MGNPEPQITPPKAERLVSLDAYRGFIMLVMASGGFGFPQMARKFTDSMTWQFLGYQFDHVAWAGCAFWDLIQPSFMFMVGVAVPYSLARRLGDGQSFGRVMLHTVFRALLLIWLGIFLSSNWSKQTDFTFVNVLTQIGLGYVFLVLLAGRGTSIQLAAIAIILVGYWAAFATHPLRPSDFDYRTVLDPKMAAEDMQHLYSGFFAHWNKNTNWAADVDVVFLNWFPRTEPFRFNRGGYQTLNFIPSLATMIFGLIAGEMLRSSRSAREKFLRLVVWGAICLALGFVADQTMCPSVKRIWTPSWAVFSTGWTLWMLAGFYWLIDMQGWRAWAFPFVVVGMNSIAMYCMAQLMTGWVKNTFKIHLGQEIFDGTYGPILASVSALAVLWLVCYWMWRKKVFVRI